VRWQRTCLAQRVQRVNVVQDLADCQAHLRGLVLAIWFNWQIGAPVKRSLISYDPLSCPYLPVNDLGDNIW
jgi:hypothetical protein